MELMDRMGAVSLPASQRESQGLMVTWFDGGYKRVPRQTQGVE